MSNVKKLWPIEPLERVVSRSGKPLGELARANGNSDERADKLADYYREGQKDGFLTLRAMDSLCVEALGVHPMQVYGLDYFDPKYDGIQRKSKPCKMCGAPKGAGSHTYCDECLERESVCSCGCGREKQFRRRFAPGCPNQKLGRRAKAS